MAQIDWQQFLDFAKECRENHIPVVREQTAKLLCEIVASKVPKQILEIGTAVGYSGTLMLLSSQNSKLTTLDSNEEMCKKANAMFQTYGVNKRVQVQNIDALQFLEHNTQNFDFIFVDGPKGQYIKYLPYLKKCLNDGGTMFCDDVLYFGMIKDDSLIIHKKITIVRNLREFLEKVQTDIDFDSKLIDIEDGILIATKVK